MSHDRSSFASSLARRAFVQASVAVGSSLVLPSAQAADLTGCWEGCWFSCTTGHTGPIKAEVCRLNDCQYDFRFRGRFAKIIPFRYREQLDIACDGDPVRFKGSVRIGPIAGSFCYDGTATQCDFHLDYQARKDYGWFKMKRVG